MPGTTKRSLRKRSIALLCAAAAFAAACGSSGDDDSDSSGDGVDKVVYALNAATPSWCLPEARLAPEGIQVARSIYDTLTVPDNNGDYRPHLAESVEPNEDNTEWTITLRPDVVFHDGTPLDAEVVANNINAWRGQYPPRSPDLFIFVYQDIENVRTEGELTVVVELSRPWVSFDAHLFNYGRSGIMAQVQLDDENDCASNLVGTGPFTLDNWDRGTDAIQLSRNEEYWRTDEAGNQLPYLDELEYRPIPVNTQRKNALDSGDIDAFHLYSNEGARMFTQMQDEAENGNANFVASDDFAEVGLLILNTAEPPFDNIIAREAAARAIDRDGIAQELGLEDLSDLANASGPFPPGSLGYLEDAGYPEYNVEEAQRLVQQYESETGQPLEFEMIHPSVPALERLAQLTEASLEEAGMEVEPIAVRQAQLIDEVVNGTYQASQWRNYPALDPDVNYVWWYGEGNPINFGRFDDPEINSLFDEGRETDDPAERQRIYEDINRRLSEQLYMLWATWTTWAVATDTDIDPESIVGARAAGSPDDGSVDYTGLAVGHDPALIQKVDE